MTLIVVVSKDKDELVFASDTSVCRLLFRPFVVLVPFVRLATMG